jgi:uncharacterized membrane protein
MPFCTKCGAQFSGEAAFCPKCGAVQASGTTPAASPNPGPAHSPTAGISENVAGLLCYVLGWITGIIFLIVDKRPFVRFHAAQSIVVFGALNLIQIVLSMATGGSLFLGGGFATLSAGLMILHLLGLLALVLWILLMVKAYQGQRFKLPVAGDFAESLAGKA